jgi:branched-chain amino acid aminotransferase
MSIVFFKGKFVDESEAYVSIKTHALQYGTGCFAGIRGYWNPRKENIYIFRIRDHYKRMENSGRILFMKLPYTVDELVDITCELIKRNNFRQNIYIRPFLYKASLALTPKLHDVEDDFFIYIIPLDDYLDTNKGLRVMISSWRRISDNSIPTRAKASGGYINSALAKTEALLNGYDESIFLDEKGYVSEGSAANLFIVRDKKLITSPVSCDILEGITRRTVIQVAKEVFNIEVEVRNISRTELYVADEMFFVGTGVQIAWIKEIDGRVVGDGNIGPITTKLRDFYFKLVSGEVEEYKDWLTEVY